MAGSQDRVRVKVSKGIYSDRWGFAAKVQVGARQVERRFPPDTKLTTIKAWRDETRVELRKVRDVPVQGAFSADVTRHLATLTHLPTYAERTHILNLWVSEFGDRLRGTITTTEIDTVLSRWLSDGLAASTVKHRRSALLYLWNRLDGEDSRNPVRAALVPQEPKPEARALSYAQIEAILAAMPDTGRREAGLRVTAGSKTKARLRVMAYTGLPQSSLMRLQPQDVNFTKREITIRPRRKGQGTNTIVVPLTAPGVKALRAFAKLDAWGTFSTSSMYASFQRACEHVGVTARPYDLRHSFGTTIYETSGDIRATQLMLAHASSTTTARYTLGAEAKRLRTVVGQAFPKIVAVSRGSTAAKRQKRKKQA